VGRHTWAASGRPRPAARAHPCPDSSPSRPTGSPGTTQYSNGGKFSHLFSNKYVKLLLYNS